MNEPALKSGALMPSAFLQYEIKASDELELIAADYYDIEELYHKIYEYVAVVKELEELVACKLKE